MKLHPAPTKARPSSLVGYSMTAQTWPDHDQNITIHLEFSWGAKYLIGPKFNLLNQIIDTHSMLHARRRLEFLAQD